MADGRRREFWEHTSHLMWLTREVNCDPKRSRRMKPTDFNPYAHPSVGNKVGPTEKVTIATLKGLFA